MWNTAPGESTQTTYFNVRRVDVSCVVLFSGNQLHAGAVVRQDVVEAVFVRALRQLGDAAFPRRMPSGNALVFL